MFCCIILKCARNLQPFPESPFHHRNVGGAGGRKKRSKFTISWLDQEIFYLGCWSTKLKHGCSKRRGEYQTKHCTYTSQTMILNLTFSFQDLMYLIKVKINNGHSVVVMRCFQIFFHFPFPQTVSYVCLMSLMVLKWTLSSIMHSQQVEKFTQNPLETLHLFTLSPSPWSSCPFTITLCVNFVTYCGLRIFIPIRVSSLYVS